MSPKKKSPQTKNQLKVSIIIPAYNEEHRIGSTLDAYASFFDESFSDQYEILVVLNGCRDNTEKIVKQQKKKHAAIRMMVIDEAIGKGGAIIEGLKNVHGGLVGYTDADGSTSARMLVRLYSVLEMIPTVDCVVASRFVPGSVLGGYSKKLHARSRGFNRGVNFLFNLGISDTQCGAKVIRASIIPDILPSLVLSDMAIDVNFLVDIKRKNYNILEIPIHWEHDMNSTISSPFKTSFFMALSVVRLRLCYSPLYHILKYVEPVSRLVYKRGLEYKEKTRVSEEEYAN